MLCSSCGNARAIVGHDLCPACDEEALIDEIAARDDEPDDGDRDYAWNQT